MASGALDRAVDVAATLEVRGYGAARRPPRGGARPWSRHDLAFAASALALVRARRRRMAPGTCTASRPIPTFSAPVRRGRSSRCAPRWPLCALLPFADRRGIGPMSAALRLDRVTYRYPGAPAPALRDVDLAIEPGEFVVLAGGSGSGKSTLLRAASGLVPHFHGGEFAGRLRGRRPGHARRTGRPRSPPSRARSSRTPRRRS